MQESKSDKVGSVIKQVEDKSFKWIKVLIPFIMMLGGSEVWQYTHAPEKIKEVAHNEIDKVIIEKLHDKIDSISQSIASKEYAKGSLENAVSDIKQMNGIAAKIYLSKVFRVVDVAIKNDSIWRNVQLPFIVEQMKKQFICPVLNLETNELTFNGFNVKKGRPRELQRNRKLTNDIYFYRDENDLLIPIYSLGRPIYKE